jgi:hypothetical protein
MRAYLRVLQAPHPFRDFGFFRAFTVGPLIAGSDIDAVAVVAAMAAADHPGILSITRDALLAIPMDIFGLNRY